MSNHSAPPAEAIQQTLTAFRSQCEEWGREFESLLDELETLPAPGTLTTDELDHVVRRQDAMGDELATVHSLVERQFELLNTLVGSSQESS